MASSVNEPDELNPVLQLATQAGKMALSCPLGITHCMPLEYCVLLLYYKSFIDQAYKVKMAGYWLCSFLGGWGVGRAFIDREGVKVQKHPKKE